MTNYYVKLCWPEIEYSYAYRGYSCRDKLGIEEFDNDYWGLRLD